jgi:hypothetical protein
VQLRGRAATDGRSGCSSGDKVVILRILKRSDEDSYGESVLLWSRGSVSVLRAASARYVPCCAVNWVNLMLFQQC